MSKERIRFNYPVLRNLDMVCCAGRSPFATITRIVTAGRANILNHNIAVHTGIVFELEGQKLIAEMQPEGLQLNSLERYNTVGGKRWVISIRRHPILSVPEVISWARKQIATDLRRGLEYDFKGLVEFVTSAVKDNKNRAYCSEYYFQLTRKYTKYPDKFYTKVSPHDLQVLGRGWVDVQGWNGTGIKSDLRG